MKQTAISGLQAPSLGHSHIEYSTVSHVCEPNSPLQPGTVRQQNIRINCS